ncbi:MAG: hypothetical protein JNM26_11930, partial [Ideonella sp.]|nr:hypothetical protein [Ideonella sp.]
CVRRGFPYQGLGLCDADGRRHAEVPTPRLAGPTLPGALGMVYGDLLALLRDAARGAGVRLHAGRPVVDAGPQGRLQTEDGQVHRVDLAVLACGLRLPHIAGGPARPLALEALPQQWCHALLARPLTLEQAAWVLGPGPTKLMLVPVDARRAGVVLQQPPGAPTTGAAIRARLAGQGRWLAQFAAHWHDDTPALLRPVATGLLDGAWHDHGVLRIGHAAHVLPPHFGQAAAQTVEDAVVLGELLKAGLRRDALLAAFMARRAERARQVHAVVTQAAHWDLRPEPATDLPALAARLAPLVSLPP